MNPIDRLLYGRIVSNDLVEALCWVRDRDEVLLKEKYSSRTGGILPRSFRNRDTTLTGSEAVGHVERFNPYVYSSGAVLRERAAIFGRHSREENVRLTVVQI